MRPFVRRFVLLGVVMAVLAVPAMSGAVSGFTGMLFGLAKAPNGDILVADAFVGIVEVHDGVIGKTIPLPGVTDMSPTGRGEMWATTGGGEDPTSAFLYYISKGKPKPIADLGDFEERKNPHPAMIDSNPFDVQALGTYSALVADAAGNDLLRVNRKGRVNVLAVFPDEEVSTANLQTLIGCPNAVIPDLAFVCGVSTMPAEPVSTSVAIGPDGRYYVGELKGFPAPTGESNIWRVDRDASWAKCGESHRCKKVFDGGFTSIIDLAFGPDGKLYVAEMDEKSWFAAEIGAGTGGTINRCDVKTQTCEEVASGIPMLTAITFDKQGNLWATQNSLIPGLAEVVQVGIAP